MTTAKRLVEVLGEKRLTCATAESCTGGGVGFGDSWGLSPMT